MIFLFDVVDTVPQSVWSTVGPLANHVTTLPELSTERLIGT